jgi:hypothetical protein
VGTTRCHEDVSGFRIGVLVTRPYGPATPDTLRRGLPVERRLDIGKNRRFSSELSRPGAMGMKALRAGAVSRGPSHLLSEAEAFIRTVVPFAAERRAASRI